MAAPFVVEPLEASHDRAGFFCGVEALDRYFLKQVTQDVRRRVAACYVVLDEQTAKVAGYYTLAAAGIPLAEMPADLAKRLPRYPSVPVARLGRLAVDQRLSRCNWASRPVMGCRTAIPAIGDRRFCLGGRRQG